MKLIILLDIISQDLLKGGYSCQYDCKRFSNFNLKIIPFVFGIFAILPARHSVHLIILQFIYDLFYCLAWLLWIAFFEKLNTGKRKFHRRHLWFGCTSPFFASIALWLRSFYLTDHIYCVACPMSVAPVAIGCLFYRLAGQSPCPPALYYPYATQYAKFHSKAVQFG